MPFKSSIYCLLLLFYKHVLVDTLKRHAFLCDGQKTCLLCIWSAAEGASAPAEGSPVISGDENCVLQVSETPQGLRRRGARAGREVTSSLEGGDSSFGQEDQLSYWS